MLLKMLSSYPWTNSNVEGNINRLKIRKRKVWKSRFRITQKKSYSIGSRIATNLTKNHYFYAN